MARHVRLSMVQMRDAGTPTGCIEAASSWIEKAADDGAQVICLQELVAGPYPCQSEDHRNFDYAEPIPGPSVEAISKIAKKREVVVVVPLFERRAPGVYHNTVAVIDADGSLAGIYRKMHIPDDPLFYEKFYFTPGDLGFTPIRTRYANLGIGICWDQWFPEAARLFALAGAEILLYPTAIGWIDEEKEEFGKAQHEAWQTSMRAHAIANGLWLGAANRVGLEGRLEFWALRSWLRREASWSLKGTTAPNASSQLIVRWMRSMSSEHTGPFYETDASTPTKVCCGGGSTE